MLFLRRAIAPISPSIRTYNYPQGRITDHRINLTLYQLPEVLAGELSGLIDTLRQEHQIDELKLAGATVLRKSYPTLACTDVSSVSWNGSPKANAIGLISW